MVHLSVFEKQLKDIQSSSPIDLTKLLGLQSEVKGLQPSEGRKDLLIKIQNLLPKKTKLKPTPKPSEAPKKYSPDKSAPKKSAPKKTNKDDTSRELSWKLRHDKEARQKRVIGPDGFASIEALGFDYDQVLAIVSADKKGRFGMEQRDGKWFIRCNQGHTIYVPDLDLNELTLDTLQDEYPLHGTSIEAWKKIKDSGISRMGRQHSHFAKGLPGESGVISGMRKDCRVVIYIDARKVIGDDIPLFESTNGVILCPGVGPEGMLDKKYFHRVTIDGVDVDLNESSTSTGITSDELYTKMSFY